MGSVGRLGARERFVVSLRKMIIATRDGYGDAACVVFLGLWVWGIVFQRLFQALLDRLHFDRFIAQICHIQLLPTLHQQHHERHGQSKQVVRGDTCWS